MPNNFLGQQYSPTINSFRLTCHNILIPYIIMEHDVEYIIYLYSSKNLAHNHDEIWAVYLPGFIVSTSQTSPLTSD